MIEEITKNFWDNIRIRLKELNQTQKWLALELKINLHTMQGWIRTNILPDVWLGYKISLLLDISLKKLLTNQDSEISQNIQEIQLYLQKINSTLEKINKE